MWRAGAVARGAASAAATAPAGAVARGKHVCRAVRARVGSPSALMQCTAGPWRAASTAACAAPCAAGADPGAHAGVSAGAGAAGTLQRSQSLARGRVGDVRTLGAARWSSTAMRGRGGVWGGTASPAEWTPRRLRRWASTETSSSERDASVDAEAVAEDGEAAVAADVARAAAPVAPVMPPYKPAAYPFPTDAELAEAKEWDDTLPPTIEQARVYDKITANTDNFDVHNEEGNLMIPNDSGKYHGVRVWGEETLQREELRGQSMPPNPYSPSVEYDDKWSTSLGNPADHTEAQEGLYYTLPADEELKALFPEGLAGDVADEFDTTGHNMLQIRKPALTLIDKMRTFARRHEWASAAPEAKAEEDGAHGVGKAQIYPFKLLTGERGSGKSAALNHVVHYARANGWLTLFIPSAHHIMRDGLVLSQSRTRPGMVDQHDIASEILRHTLAAHRDLLGIVPQRGVYPRHWFLPADEDAAAIEERERLRSQDDAERRRLRAEATAAGNAYDKSAFESKLKAADANTDIDRSGFTLLDLVSWGLNHPAMATDTLIALRAELGMQTEVPVLVAIDGINSFYDPDVSVYPQDGKFVPPENLSIPALFRVLTPEGVDPSVRMKRGLTIATETRTHRHKPPMFEKVKVRHKWTVPVEPLSRVEVHSTLSYYTHTQCFFELLRSGPLDSHSVELFRQLTDANPRELYNCAMFVG